MNLLDKVNAQLKESALKQDKDKVLTLRLIVSAVKDKEIEKRGAGAKDTSIKDEDVFNPETEIKSVFVKLCGS